MWFCEVFINSAGYRCSPDICADGLVFSIVMISPEGHFWGGTICMLNVPPKTYNKKHTTTGDHVDRRILQYSRANKRIIACQTVLILCIVTHFLCKERHHPWVHKNMGNIVPETNRFGANITVTISISGERRRPAELLHAPQQHTYAVDNPQTGLVPYVRRHRSWWRASCTSGGGVSKIAPGGTFVIPLI